MIFSQHKMNARLKIIKEMVQYNEVENIKREQHITVAGKIAISSSRRLITVEHSPNFSSAKINGFLGNWAAQTLNASSILT